MTTFIARNTLLPALVFGLSAMNYGIRVASLMIVMTFASLHGADAKPKGGASLSCIDKASECMLRCERRYREWADVMSCFNRTCIHQRDICLKAERAQ